MSQSTTGNVDANPASSGVSSVARTGKNTTSNGNSQQQYRIVKVRKPDGTIVKVKRPITAEESAQLALAKPESKPASSTPAPAKSVESTITVTSVPIHEQSVTNVTATKTTVAITSSTSTNESTTKTTVAKNTEKANSSAATITPSTIAQPDKTAEKSKESSKPAESNATTKTEEALNTTTNTTTKGSRFYRGLHKLQKGSSRIVTVLSPEWDVGDWQEGDEEYDNDSSDDDDNEQYDSDDEQRANNNQAQNNSQAQNIPSIDANTAARSVVSATTATVATPKTTKTQFGNDEKTTQPPPITNPKKLLVVNEKEVPASDSEKGSLEKLASPLTEGRNLKIRYKDWSRYVVWLIMIIFPLLFIAVGILVAAQNGKKVAGDVIMSKTDQALEVAISVWPIIFAGIVAQSLRAYATYRVERGVRLMTLEQLVNSNSVASSIKQPFLLRRFNAITIALLILWALSPLASQAMQRLSFTASGFDPLKIPVRYVNTAVSNSNYIAADSGTFDEIQADFNRLYPASFLPNNLQYGSDPYGNALIPIFIEEAAKNGTMYTDPTTNINGTYGTYASAYGIPIASSDSLGDITAEKYYLNTIDPYLEATISAAYFDNFICHSMQVITSNDLFNGDEAFLASQSSTLFMNMTAMDSQSKGTIFLASLITKPTNGNTSAPIDIGSLDNTYAYTNCSFSQTFIEADITCVSSDCYTTQVKKIDSPAENMAVFGPSGANNFAKGILSTSGTTNWTLATATDTEKYLMTTTGNILGSENRINLTTVDLATFTKNLAFVMNTFWTIGFAPTNLTSPFYNSNDTIAYPFNKALAPRADFGDGTLWVPYDQYQTSWAWFAALMICSTFLLLAGIFSIWWDARSVSPDVLGFASTVVRKSKYVKLPPVDSSASGAERARALGEIRVMMQDVKPNAEVGRIALGTVHPDAKRLQPGRAYR